MKSGKQLPVGQLKKLSLANSLKNHWPEYLMEAAALGIFMISAGCFTTWLESPDSFLTHAIPIPDLRRFFIGLAMGGTATILIYCPWGVRSGAHMNPAITITFLRLGKIPPWDAGFYIVFQFLGGLAGVELTTLALGHRFTNPPVHSVVTVPGPQGDGAAFMGELGISILMMGVILYATNRPRLAPFTGLLAGLLITSFVTFESPVSGFGMNPARTFASALPSGVWTALWIYFSAAPMGMLLAAEIYLQWQKS